MKNILLFIAYSIVCLVCIYVLTKIVAVIAVTVITVLSCYLIMKQLNVNERYIKGYIRLRQDLSEAKLINRSGYLCVLSSQYPDWFKTDLQLRLRNCNCTYPQIKTIGGYYSSEYLMEMGVALWDRKDFDSRFEFIDLVLSDLERSEKY